MMKRVMNTSRLLVAVAACVSLAACATTSYVDGKIAASEQRQTALIYEQNTQIAGLEKRFTEVLERAIDKLAGVAGEPKLTKVSQSFTVQYAVNATSVPAPVKAQIAEIAATLLASDKPFFIEIQGHTDTTGSARNNERVGAKRAEAVRQAFRANGVPLRSMSAISFGSSQPLVDETSEEDRQTNRRVEILIMQ